MSLCLAVSLLSPLAAAHGGGHSAASSSAAAKNKVNNAPVKANTVPATVGGPATSGSCTTGNGAVTGTRSSASTTSFAADAATTWQHWWEVNRDALLRNWDSNATNDALSPSTGVLSGRGRRDRALGDAAKLVSVEIIPALQRLLRQEDDAYICDSSVMSLARVAGPEMAAFVLRDVRSMFTHDALSVQTAATLSLGVLGSVQSTDTLIGLMSDTSPGRRALGVDRVPWQVRSHAAVALGLVGSGAAVDSLGDIVANTGASEQDLRVCAATALGLVRGPGRDAALVVALTLTRQDLRDPAVKAALVAALGKLDAYPALPRLVEWAEDRDVEQAVRRAAVLALGRLGTLDQEGVVEALVRLVKKERLDGVRQLAFMSLAKVGARTPVGREQAQAHDDLVKLLTRQVRHPDRKRDRSWAALACGVYAMGHPARRASLAEVLVDHYEDEKDPLYKSVFALALGLVKARDAGEQLQRDLERVKDRTFKGYAALALGMLGRHEATEDLLARATHPTTGSVERLQIVRALGIMGSRRATPELLAALEESDSDAVSWSLARALGRLRDERSVWPLIRLAEDTGRSDLTRAFASLALGLVGEKEWPRWNTRLLEDLDPQGLVPTLAAMVTL